MSTAQKPAMDFAALEQAYEFDVYPKRDVTIVRGKNALVWDDQGNEYIDCIVGHGVANLGHAHPVIVDAIQRQAEKLILRKRDRFVKCEPSSLRSVAMRHSVSSGENDCW